MVSIIWGKSLTCGVVTLKDVPVVGVAGRGAMLFWAWAWAWAWTWAKACWETMTIWPSSVRTNTIPEEQQGAIIRGQTTFFFLVIFPNQLPHFYRFWMKVVGILPLPSGQVIQWRGLRWTQTILQVCCYRPKMLRSYSNSQNLLFSLLSCKC